MMSLDELKAVLADEWDDILKAFTEPRIEEVIEGVANLRSALSNAIEQIEKMREYILEEVGAEHVPVEFGGKLD